METTDRSAEHAAICQELTELYARKNHDYGDSFHITFQKWGLTMSAIRLGDKLQRLETLIRAESQVKDESIRDTLIDLANYAIMTVMELDRENASREMFRVSCGNCGYVGDVSKENADINLIANTVACPKCGFSLNLPEDYMKLFGKEKTDGVHENP